MINEYKLVYLDSKILKSQRTGNDYIRFNYVLSVPYNETDNPINVEFRRVSGFTISNKDIVDLGNKELPLNPKYIIESKGKNHDGEEVTYYHYDIDKARNDTTTDTVVNDWAKK